MYRVEGLGLEGLGIFSPQNDRIKRGRKWKMKWKLGFCRGSTRGRTCTLILVMVNVFLQNIQNPNNPVAISMFAWGQERPKC